VTIPDGKVTWIPFAAIKAYWIIKREGIRYVYATGKPFSSFVLGCILKRLTGVRLLIDYRDPWTQNLNYFRRSPIHTWLEKKMEGYIVRHSDAVIANTKVNEGELVREFGKGQERGKFITIYNGFDAADFSTGSGGKYEKFTITYAGAFYYSVGSDFSKSAGDRVMETYSPFYFFEALKNLFAERPDIKQNIQICFMGVLGHGYDPIIREMGLDGVVKRLGYIDYGEHVAVLKKSHVMLLVLSRGEISRGWVPSKFFQYLGSGNPILALAPEGEVIEIMRRSRAGVFVPPDDVEGAARAIAELYDCYERGEAFQRNESEVGKFERRHLTSLLAGTLEKCGIA
jgi:glycosyltransferase involved in cell wall biosynthesis